MSPAPRVAKRAALPIAALLAILVVTVVWWTFALWPANAHTPDWLLRTRYVCFGNRGNGLPAAEGWLLLVGQPFSMLGFLMIVWGGELHSALRSAWPRRSTQVSAALIACALTAGASLVVVRVTTAQSRASPAAAVRESAQRLDAAAPALALRDQHGLLIDLADLRGRPVVVAFAFAHCETICPLIVHDVNSALAHAPDLDAVALIVTVDPWRDTPERLPSIARQWQLPDNVHLLGGSVARVHQTLSDWGVAALRDDHTGTVTHSGNVYLVDRAGRLAYSILANEQELLKYLKELAR